MAETPRSDLPRSSLRPPSRGPWIAVAVAALAIGAAVVLWPRGKKPEAPPSAPDAGALAVDAGSGAADAGPPVDTARVRPALESVATGPLFRRGLDAGDPVRRWAALLESLAEGDSPRAQLPFLAPAGPFSVVRRGDAAVIAPASYARYDAFAAEVAAVDAKRLAAVYRELHGAVEAAYRALGYPEGSLDEVTGRALKRIVDAPVAEGEIAVIDEGGLWAFADPKLEEVGDVEKHLLRMGPANTRKLQAKARELLAALGLRGGSPPPAGR